MDLRPYQIRSIDAVREAWSQGAQRTCLVLPTGAGKTVTANALATEHTIWLVHRRELADQAPGRAETIQGLLASGRRPDCDLLIADECHHVGSESAPQWHALAQHYPRILGLTATPERGDGTPLGDLFDSLVVGAHYSELVAGGWIMEPTVYRPAGELQGLAAKPEAAWKQHAAGSRRGFAFFSRVEQAKAFAAAVAGAAPIWGDMPGDERAVALDRFRCGLVTCLANVQVLTEGVDVPEAEICMLASGCQHAGAYLQRVGRVLRPAPGKARPVVVDLPGLSWRFGLPTADREYSLTGRAIRAKTEALRVCEKCGRTYPSAEGACPGCGFLLPPKPARVRIWDLPLEDALAQASTPKEIGQAAWRKRAAANPEAEMRRLQGIAASRGYKPGWATYRFKLATGRWPTRKEMGR
jgi:superfamily II DNA or RNA helicase